MSVQVSKVTGAPRSVSYADGIVTLINQPALPAKLELVACNTVKEVAHAIKIMTVRGAPAIGAAGAFAMGIAARAAQAEPDCTTYVLRATEGKMTWSRPAREVPGHRCAHPLPAACTTEALLLRTCHPLLMS